MQSSTMPPPRPMDAPSILISGPAVSAADPAAGDPASARVLGLSRRKRRYLAAFLPATRLRPTRDASGAAPGEALIVWASSAAASSLESRPDQPLLRIEDGFLRSVGLGAQLTRPLSWVVDSRGIYYDPCRPSDLEHLLSTTIFTPSLLGRAARLRERIVAHDISKYNVGDTDWQELSPAAATRPVVLVAGQVEADASLRAGAGPARSNAALIAAARAAHPDGWLVYKPHPDVVAGLRRAGRDEHDATRLCDEVVTAAPISRLIERASAVHVMTSLTGFEALLRGKQVHCHGLPFYAGWGLTFDTVRAERRGRRLTLDELVAAALILYPRYVSLRTGRPCAVEQTLDELIDWRARDNGAPRWWQRLLKPVLRRD